MVEGKIMITLIKKEICKKFHKEIESSEDYLGVSKGENIVNLSEKKDNKKTNECCKK